MHKNQQQFTDFFKKDILMQLPITKTSPTFYNALAIPFIYLHSFDKQHHGQFYLGAQNAYFLKEGSYTGEISPAMLQDAKVDFILVGHAERRNHFQETNQLINQKVQSFLENDFKVVLCVGESAQAYQQHQTISVLTEQITSNLQNINWQHDEQLIIAYEPVWCIGTGKNMDDESLKAVFEFIQKILHEKFPTKKIPILYGGSVTSQNLTVILEQGYHGVLVGKASLEITEILNMTNIMLNK